MGEVTRFENLLYEAVAVPSPMFRPVFLQPQSPAASAPHPELAAGTWSGVTRVAGSNPQLWSEILRHNRENRAAQIDELIALLQQARSHGEFKSLWQKAAQIKNNQGW